MSSCLHLCVTACKIVAPLFIDPCSKFQDYSKYLTYFKQLYVNMLTEYRIPKQQTHIFRIFAFISKTKTNENVSEKKGNARSNVQMLRTS